MNTLCWSLTKSKNDPIKFHQSVYDMYYLSISMAKQLGYTTVLYGNSDAIENLKDIVDSVVNIDFLDYQLYDDPKVFIWYSRKGEYATIDGDVFLYNRLKFRSDSDSRYKLSVENNQIMIDKTTKSTYNMFCTQGSNKIIPFWDTYRTDSFNTGIIKWNDTSLRNTYISYYHLFRKWYMDNKNNMNLPPDISISSHIICEQLLYKLMINNGYNVDVLKTNGENSYSHFVGSQKFTDPEKFIPIKLLVDEIRNLKNMGLTNRMDIKRIYFKLAEFYGAI